jgi:hypothetical protein
MTRSSPLPDDIEMRLIEQSHTLKFVKLAGVDLEEAAAPLIVDATSRSSILTHAPFWLHLAHPFRLLIQLSRGDGRKRQQQVPPRLAFGWRGYVGAAELYGST